MRPRSTSGHDGVAELVRLSGHHAPIGRKSDAQTNLGQDLPGRDLPDLEHDPDPVGQPDRCGGRGSRGRRSTDHCGRGRRSALCSSPGQPRAVASSTKRAATRSKPRDRANASSVLPLRSHSARTPRASASVQWGRRDVAGGRLAMPKPRASSSEPRHRTAAIGANGRTVTRTKRCAETMGATSSAATAWRQLSRAS
jgi:hypothetical protein